ncbi:MAG: hypothetical protein QG671_4433 [Actinomycetota bacterium]|nr:hypothetical protein [Actinomycetota bacterium]
MNARDAVRRALAATPGSGDPGAVNGGFTAAIARRLEERGIAQVPGIHTADQPPDWWDLLIEVDRRHRQAEQRRLERQRLEEEVSSTPPTAAGVLAAEITRQAGATSSISMPLNGAAVLRAALAGGPGTVNSDPVADRMDSSG